VIVFLSPKRQIDLIQIPKVPQHIAVFFFDVNVMPGCKLDFLFKNSVISIPDKMPKTGPPTIGNRFPKYQQGIEIARHRANPFHISFILFKTMPPSPTL
jgi:hypothetical protein